MERRTWIESDVFKSDIPRIETILMLGKIIFIAGACVFLVLFIWMARKKQTSKKKHLSEIVATKNLSSLVKDFSGDNLCDTELDLAQAYLELHQYEKAKHLLKSVITQGQPHQILEARKMFTQLLKQERLAS